jgi:hypothetical protein
MWYVILLCLYGGTPSWEFNPYWNLQLLYTITCHLSYLLVTATTEETREKSAKSSVPTFHTDRNRKLTTTWSVWRGEAGLVQPDPVYTHEPAVSLFLSPSPLRHIQSRRKRGKTKAVSESRLCFKMRIAEGQRWRIGRELLFCLNEYACGFF